MLKEYVRDAVHMVTAGATITVLLFVVNGAWALVNYAVDPAAGVRIDPYGGQGMITLAAVYVVIQRKKLSARASTAPDRTAS